MIGAILLAIIALSSSTSLPNNERNILIRFYSDFAQVYRPAILKPHPSELNREQSIEQYQFFFTEKEYSQISEESLTMLYRNVIERTITYHPMPNFEVVGSRYFYRRDPKQIDAIEIELVNPEDRLFRDVQEPNRYFYLSSFDGLEYTNQVPVMPYYEVTFICNSTDIQKQSPLLSYIDKNFQWTPRYLLDLSAFGTNNQSEMYAYADLHNNGEQSVVIKGVEIIAGDIKLNPKSVEYLRTGLSYGANFDVLLSTYTTDSSSTRPLGEQASGTYVYQLLLSSFMTLPSHSMKSVELLQVNVTVEPFLYYSSVFSPVNSRGKLLNAYNLTSLNAFIPNGCLLLREQGRFIGQINLPDLTVNETFTMVFGSDPDILYDRRVKIIEGDEDSDSITYYVEYVFENYKLTRDVRVYFMESFGLFKYFQVQNISTVNNQNNFPDLVLYGTDLRGYMVIPRQRSQIMFSYNLITYKDKPTATVREE